MAAILHMKKLAHSHALKQARKTRDSTSTRLPLIRILEDEFGIRYTEIDRSLIDLMGLAVNETVTGKGAVEEAEQEEVGETGGGRKSALGMDSMMMPEQLRSVEDTLRRVYEPATGKYVRLEVGSSTGSSGQVYHNLTNWHGNMLIMPDGIELEELTDWHFLGASSGAKMNPTNSQALLKAPEGVGSGGEVAGGLSNFMAKNDQQLDIKKVASAFGKAVDVVRLLKAPKDTPPKTGSSAIASDSAASDRDGTKKVNTSHSVALDDIGADSVGLGDSMPDSLALVTQSQETLGKALIGSPTKKTGKRVSLDSEARVSNGVPDSTPLGLGIDANNGKAVVNFQSDASMGGAGINRVATLAPSTPYGGKSRRDQLGGHQGDGSIALGGVRSTNSAVSDGADRTKSGAQGEDGGVEETATEESAALLNPFLRASHQSMSSPKAKTIYDNTSTHVYQNLHEEPKVWDYLQKDAPSFDMFLRRYGLRSGDSFDMFAAILGKLQHEDHDTGIDKLHEELLAKFFETKSETTAEKGGRGSQSKGLATKSTELTADQRATSKDRRDSEGNVIRSGSKENSERRGSVSAVEIGKTKTSQVGLNVAKQASDTPEEIVLPQDFLHFEIFFPCVKVKFRAEENRSCLSQENLYQHTHYVQELYLGYKLKVHDFEIITNVPIVSEVVLGDEANEMIDEEKLLKEIKERVFHPKRWEEARRERLAKEKAEAASAAERGEAPPSKGKAVSQQISSKTQGGSPAPRKTSKQRETKRSQSIFIPKKPEPDLTFMQGIARDGSRMEYFIPWRHPDGTRHHAILEALGETEMADDIMDPELLDPPEEEPNFFSTVVTRAATTRRSVFPHMREEENEIDCSTGMFEFKVASKMSAPSGLTDSYQLKKQSSLMVTTHNFIPYLKKIIRRFLFYSQRADVRHHLKKLDLVDTALRKREDVKQAHFTKVISGPVCKNGHAMRFKPLCDLGWKNEIQCYSCKIMTDYGILTCRQRCEMPGFCENCHVDLKWQKKMTKMNEEQQAENDYKKRITNATATTREVVAMPSGFDEVADPIVALRMYFVSNIPTSEYLSDPYEFDGRFIQELTRLLTDDDTIGPHRQIIVLGGKDALKLDVVICHPQFADDLVLKSRHYRGPPQLGTLALTASTRSTSAWQAIGRESSATLQHKMSNSMSPKKPSSYDVRKKSTRSSFSLDEEHPYFTQPEFTDIRNVFKTISTFVAGTYGGEHPDRYNKELYPILSRSIRCDLGYIVSARDGFMESMPMKGDRLIPEKRPRRRYVECPLGCDLEAVQDCDLNDHKMFFCPKRIVPCTLKCGCEMRFEQLESHVADKCVHRIVKCPLCSFQCKQKDLKLHMEECDHRPWTCELCQTRAKVKDIDEHKKECIYRVVQCNWCNSDCVFKDLKFHKKQRCPRRYVKSAELRTAVFFQNYDLIQKHLDDDVPATLCANDPHLLECGVVSRMEFRMVEDAEYRTGSPIAIVATETNVPLGSRPTTNDGQQRVFVGQSPEKRLEKSDFPGGLGKASYNYLHNATKNNSNLMNSKYMEDLCIASNVPIVRDAEGIGAEGMTESGSVNPGVVSGFMESRLPETAWREKEKSSRPHSRVDRKHPNKLQAVDEDSSSTAVPVDRSPTSAGKKVGMHQYPASAVTSSVPKDANVHGVSPRSSSPFLSRGNGRPGSRQDLRPGSQEGRPGSKTQEMRPGSQQGGRPGSQQGGRSGSQQGLRPGSQQGGRPGSQQGRPGSQGLADDSEFAQWFGGGGGSFQTVDEDCEGFPNEQGLGGLPEGANTAPPGTTLADLMEDSQCEPGSPDWIAGNIVRQHAKNLGIPPPIRHYTSTNASRLNTAECGVLSDRYCDGFGNTNASLGSLRLDGIGSDAYNTTPPPKQYKGIFGRSMSDINVSDIQQTPGYDDGLEGTTGTKHYHSLALTHDESIEMKIEDLTLANSSKFQQIDSKLLYLGLALHSASIIGDPTIAMTLIEAQADLYLRDNHGKTALHLAAMHGNTTVIDVLLEMERKTGESKLPFVLDHEDRTPLFLAAFHRKRACVERLYQMQFEGVPHMNNIAPDISVFSPKNKMNTDLNSTLDSLVDSKDSEAFLMRKLVSRPSATENNPLRQGLARPYVPKQSEAIGKLVKLDDTSSVWGSPAGSPSATGSKIGSPSATATGSKKSPGTESKKSTVNESMSPGKKVNESMSGKKVKSNGKSPGSEKSVALQDVTNGDVKPKKVPPEPVKNIKYWDIVSSQDEDPTKSNRWQRYFYRGYVAGLKEDEKASAPGGSPQSARVTAQTDASKHSDVSQMGKAMDGASKGMQISQFHSRDSAFNVSKLSFANECFLNKNRHVRNRNDNILNRDLRDCLWQTRYNSFLKNQISSRLNNEIDIGDENSHSKKFNRLSSNPAATALLDMQLGIPNSGSLLNLHVRSADRPLTSDIVLSQPRRRKLLYR